MTSAFYDDLKIHEVMLRDDVRNQAYRRAIFASIKKGDVVLDAGAGTGILSLFAAQAGAKTVYAVERTTVADLARKIVMKNGFGDRVEVIQSDLETVRLPQKVDVIVSEWLGAYGVDENMLTPVLAARDRWLKPGARMIPERAQAWLAPVWDASLDEKMCFFESRPYDIDFSLLLKGSFHNLHWNQRTLTEDEIAAAPQMMWVTDTYTCSVEQSRLPLRASLRFSALRGQRLNALTAWFHAEFGGGVTLTNAPDALPTHWGQYVFPLNRAVEVERGDRIAVEFTCIPTVNSFCHHAWSVKIAGRSWEHHDTRIKI